MKRFSLAMLVTGLFIAFLAQLLMWDEQGSAPLFDSAQDVAIWVFHTWADAVDHFSV